MHLDQRINYNQSITDKGYGELEILARLFNHIVSVLKLSNHACTVLWKVNHPLGSQSWICKTFQEDK